IVCSAFNADFDGDQMAVHVPLSLEAQLEARVLMMSTNNVLSPANGAPIIVPSQDMVLGLYYTSMERKGMKGEGMTFGSVEEVELALAAGEVHLHAKINARVKQIDDEGNEVWKRFESTPGRVRLGALLPMNAKAPFELVNRLLRKKDVQNVIDTVYRYCGQKESVIFCDQIMGMGFREAFKAGISFGKDDMLIPDSKWTIVN
ncbi:DNA-directed RNA polymerase subunit beta', partial [Thioclava sp. BHET1]